MRIRTTLGLACLLALLALGRPVHAQAAAARPQACPTLPAAQPAGARATARDRGFLWRLGKDGRTSYLYGTVHVGRPEWARPGPTVARALQASDVLAVEIDLTDPALAHDLDAGIVPMPALPAPLRERLQRQVEAACLPAAAMAAQHPMLQAVALTVQAARREGLEARYAQELVLAGLARARQQPVVSLETLRSQLAALLPADDATTIVMVQRTLQQLEDDRVRPVLARLAAAWERGDLAQLQTYERWCECVDTEQERAYMMRLNDDRNPILAARIDALHAAGRSVFAAVGALHMTGPLALPMLFKARGYDVERVALRR